LPGLAEKSRRDEKCNEQIQNADLAQHFTLPNEFKILILVKVITATKDTLHQS
jgi:hypothetical protein